MGWCHVQKAVKASSGFALSSLLAAILLTIDNKNENQNDNFPPAPFQQFFLKLDDKCALIHSYNWAITINADATEKQSLSRLAIRQLPR